MLAEVAGDDEALKALAQLPAAAAQDVVRVERVLRKTGQGVLLCLADSSSAALKVAAVAKALATRPDAPRMLLVNPGTEEQVWPWENMESILPTLEVGLHLGVPAAAFEQIAPLLFERLGHVIDEFAPLGLLSLGTSDALLACGLMAHKRGLALVRLEGGLQSAGGETVFNEALIEQLSELMFVSDESGAAERVARLGLPAERVHHVPGQLAADVCCTVEPFMTTAYGVCLRQRLPMFMGPRWSANEPDEPPYALVALSLSPDQPQQTAAVVDVLARVRATHKLIWLGGTQTRQALAAWQQDAAAELAQRCFVIEPGMSSKDLRGPLLPAYDSAHLLCTEVNSLQDQFSLLRGAVALITDPGHVLADAAGLLGVACAQRGAGGALLLGAAPAELPATLAWDTSAINAWLEQQVARGYPAEMPTFAQAHTGAAEHICGVLHDWVVARRQATGA